MTSPGQLLARPPVSPLANMRVLARTGKTKSGSAIWQLQCTCGETILANAPAIKRGAAICPTCNPTYATIQARLVLALLPCDYATIEAKLKWNDSQSFYRLTCMREKNLCHIGDWKRPKAQGPLIPIFHAGPGKDVPCKLTRRSDAEYKRRYFKRVRRAIEKAEAGIQDDGRYARHIARHLADQVEQRTRAHPNTWASALFTHMKEGSAC